MEKRIINYILILTLAAALPIGALFSAGQTASAAGISIAPPYSNTVRGAWIPFCDFKVLGLYNKPKASFIRNANIMMYRCRARGINRVYFHARAFDDAAWYSNTFKASEYLIPADQVARYKNAKAAYSAVLGYDPMRLIMESAARYGIKVEAYMNPYRITYSEFLDPMSPYSRNRIKRAVMEIKSAYKVYGIHFDDYFYHSTKYYKYTTRASQYYKNVSGKVYTHRELTPQTRRTYCNYLIRQVYAVVHGSKYKRVSGGPSLIFGISPQGNYENCMSSGADVRTWLNTRGYTDYIAPQIYWSDKYLSGSSYVTMFSNRLSMFRSLNKISLPMYAGLGLYRAGKTDRYDKGWTLDKVNISRQVYIAVNRYRTKGYILFSAKDIAYPADAAVKAEIAAYMKRITAK